MFNAFIDPAGTARAARAPLAWLWPLIILSITSVAFGMFVAPLRVNIMRQNPPPNMSGEQLEKTIQMMESFSKIGAFIIPVVIIGFIALLAALAMLMGSMMSLKVRFRDMFSLMSVCSLISCLGIIASYFVLRAKADELSSVQQLQPPFGLDIFFSDLKGPLFAILNYFSIFQVWYLVMLTLSLAYLTHSSKGKAFATITPVWLIPLLFAIVGSLFQRG